MIERKSWSCALTGHRKISPDFNVNGLYDKLQTFLERGCDTFFCGMAMGFDLTALKCLVDLKRKFHFTIEACIPYAGHEENFSAQDRMLYRELLQWCDKKTVLYGSYREGCYLARNRYMVDRANVVLAYCLRKTGGSAYTANYAMKKCIPVIFIN